MMTFEAMRGGEKFWRAFKMRYENCDQKFEKCPLFRNRGNGDKGYEVREIGGEPEESSSMERKRGKGFEIEGSSQVVMQNEEEEIALELVIGRF